MTRDEHKQAIQTLMGMIAPEHQAAASEALSALSEDYETVLTSSENLTTENRTLTDNNERLRDANMKLFLKVGEPGKAAPDKRQESTEPKLTFEALFNEKGELK